MLATCRDRLPSSPPSGQEQCNHGVHTSLLVCSAWQHGVAASIGQHEVHGRLRMCARLRASPACVTTTHGRSCGRLPSHASHGRRGTAWGMGPHLADAQDKGDQQEQPPGLLGRRRAAAGAARLKHLSHPAQQQDMGQAQKPSSTHLLPPRPPPAGGKPGTESSCTASGRLVRMQGPGC